MDIFACAFVDPIIIVAINLKWTWYVTWQEKWFQNKFCCCLCEFVHINVSVYFEWTSSISCQFFYKCWQCWMQTTSIKFHLIILSIFNCDSVHNRRVCPKIVDRLIAYWEIVAVSISLVFVVYFVFCTRDLNVNLAFHDWHKITLVALNLLELSSAHGNKWSYDNLGI